MIVSEAARPKRPSSFDARRMARFPGPLAAIFALASACGSADDGQGPTNTGHSCQVATDCYPGIDPQTLEGAPVCMTRVPDGYCTHACTQDSDCCAVTGECPDALAQVCAPFESTGEMNCFLSCEAEDVANAGYTDSTVFCQARANAAFICRSTGGGSNNRKVCVPNG